MKKTLWPLSLVLLICFSCQQADYDRDDINQRIHELSQRVDSLSNYLQDMDLYEIIDDGRRGVLVSKDQTLKYDSINDAFTPVASGKVWYVVYTHGNKTHSIELNGNYDSIPDYTTIEFEIDNPGAQIPNRRARYLGRSK